MASGSLLLDALDELTTEIKTMNEKIEELKAINTRIANK
jgi:hypothetical protein